MCACPIAGLRIQVLFEWSFPQTQTSGSVHGDGIRITTDSFLLFLSLHSFSSHHSLLRRLATFHLSRSAGSVSRNVLIEEGEDSLQCRFELQFFFRLRDSLLGAASLVLTVLFALSCHSTSDSIDSTVTERIVTAVEPLEKSLRRQHLNKMVSLWFGICHNCSLCRHDVDLPFQVFQLANMSMRKTCC